MNLCRRKKRANQTSERKQQISELSWVLSFFFALRSFAFALKFCVYFFWLVYRCCSLLLFYVCIMYNTYTCFSAVVCISYSFASFPFLHRKSEHHIRQHMHLCIYIGCVVVVLVSSFLYTLIFILGSFFLRVFFRLSRTRWCVKRIWMLKGTIAKRSRIHSFIRSTATSSVKNL